MLIEEHDIEVQLPRDALHRSHVRRLIEQSKAWIIYVILYRILNQKRRN